MTLINSPKLPLQAQVRAQLTRATLLNSALVNSDILSTVDQLSTTVFEGTEGVLEAVYTRLQACLIALDEGIKVHAIISARVEELTDIIQPID